MTGLGPRWKKSTRSNGSDSCTEVRAYAGNVEVRDTKDRTGPSLTFTPAEWGDFIAGVRGGEFDLPS